MRQRPDCGCADENGRPARRYWNRDIREGLFRNLDPARQAQIIHAPTLEEALSRLDDAAYDVVIMHHVLEHLPTPAANLRAIKGKIRPGGYIFIEVPDEQWKRQLIDLRRLLRDGGTTRSRAGDPNFFYRQTLARFVQSQGFGIVTPSSFRPPTIRISSLRCWRTARVSEKRLEPRGNGIVARDADESILGYRIVARCIARNQ